MIFHFHKWSPWSKPIATYSSRKQQWRVCQICNKAEFHTLSWDHQALINDVVLATEQSLALQKIKETK
jgi:hypothetical protein